MKAHIVEVCTSREKGTQKTPVPTARVIEGFGIEGDAHGGNWKRQISLLAQENADEMRALGAEIEPGAFGENILTRGIALEKLPLGTRLASEEVVLEVTQIGKKCHTRCAIFEAAGTCIMPTHGIFCRVIQGGILKPGLEIQRI